MQATTAPALPKIPPAPEITVIQTPAVTAGVPTTAADIQNLRAQRAELSNQLESAAGRRARLSSQLVGKEGADRAGIEARISVLDKRIMQLESDIAETGHQLTMAPGALVSSTGAPFRIDSMNPDSVGALGGAFIIFVLAPIAFTAARMMWKRTNHPPRQDFTGDAAKRLERLEQGMDAIAIEIERVSEGQRFVTRLLSEAHDAQALPVAQRIGEGTLGEGQR